jgi:hypothetical protein
MFGPSFPKGDENDDRLSLLHKDDRPPLFHRGIIKMMAISS